MKVVARSVLKFSLAVLVLTLVIGVMMWASTLRREDFYLRAALQSGAVASVWVQPFARNQRDKFEHLSQTHISVWINPARAQNAFYRLDDWIEEFTLVYQDTSDSADTDAHLLPPVPLPDSSESGDSMLDDEFDPYDEISRLLVRDIWNSGVLTVSGSSFLDAPVWMSPFLGWSGAVAQTQYSGLFFESLMNLFPIRADGFDVPSWLMSATFAHPPTSQENGVIHEAAVDFTGDDIYELYFRLCDMGNLAANVCNGESFAENPLLPLLLVSDHFHVQLNFFWAFRGQHLIWSNDRLCLAGLLAQPQQTHQGCGGGTSQRGFDPHTESFPRVQSPFQAKRRIGPAAGFWINHVALESAVDRLLTLLRSEDFKGSAWTQDFLADPFGEFFVNAIRLALWELKTEWPLSGAALEYRGSSQAVLSSYTRRSKPLSTQEGLSPSREARQFSFLNSLLSAWSGRPYSTARLTESKPWRADKPWWVAESVYRLGWSEQE